MVSREDHVDERQVREHRAVDERRSAEKVFMRLAGVRGPHLVDDLVGIPLELRKLPLVQGKTKHTNAMAILQRDFRGRAREHGVVRG